MSSHKAASTYDQVNISLCRHRVIFEQIGQMKSKQASQVEGEEPWDVQ